MPQAPKPQPPPPSPPPDSDQLAASYDPTSPMTTENLFAATVRHLAQTSGLQNLIPDVFPTAQSVPVHYVSQLPVLTPLASQQGKIIPWNQTLGMYSPPRSYLESLIRPGNMIYMNTAFPAPPDPTKMWFQQEQNPAAEMHEAGHAIWYDELSRADKSAWTALHQGYQNQPQSSPWPVNQYPDDPSHSFAAAVEMYAQDPHFLQLQAPDMYDFLKQKFAYEYRRYPVNPTLPAGSRNITPVYIRAPKRGR